MSINNVIQISWFICTDMHLFIEKHVCVTFFNRQNAHMIYFCNYTAGDKIERGIFNKYALVIMIWDDLTGCVTLIECHSCQLTFVNVFHKFLVLWTQNFFGNMLLLLSKLCLLSSKYRFRNTMIKNIYIQYKGIKLQETHLQASDVLHFNNKIIINIKWKTTNMIVIINCVRVLSYIK